MTAAAKLLHNDLYIQIVNGTRAHIDTARKLRDNKTSPDALHIQKRIGRLCSDDRRAIHIPPVEGGDGKLIIKYLRAVDNVRTDLAVLHILPEHLPDSRHIRPGAAQIGCRLKGTDTGLDHKV